MNLKVNNNRAVFLDRDGTIIDHVPYLSHPDQLKLFPDTVSSLKKIRSAGFLTIVVTNQSVVGRGLITEEELHVIHERLNALLKKGGTKLDAIYYCHHHPNDKCICRKPNVGMLLSASEKFKINLKNSYIIGDDPKDIEVGKRVGCETVLLSCGQVKNDITSITPSFQSETLCLATEWILKHAQA